jgi:hypothetical protein
MMFLQNARVFAFLLLNFLLLSYADGKPKHYIAHEHVGVTANTVGPFNNPTETYPVRYFKPFQNSNILLSLFTMIFIYLFIIFM